MFPPVLERRGLSWLLISWRRVRRRDARENHGRALREERLRRDCACSPSVVGSKISCTVSKILPRLVRLIPFFWNGSLHSEIVPKHRFLHNTAVSEQANTNNDYLPQPAVLHFLLRMLTIPSWACWAQDFVSSVSAIPNDGCMPQPSVLHFFHAKGVDHPVPGVLSAVLHCFCFDHPERRQLAAAFSSAFSAADSVRSLVFEAVVIVSAANETLVTSYLGRTKQVHRSWGVFRKNVDQSK